MSDQDASGLHRGRQCISDPLHFLLYGFVRNIGKGQYLQLDSRVSCAFRFRYQTILHTDAAIEYLLHFLRRYVFPVAQDNQIFDSSDDMNKSTFVDPGKITGF